MAHAAGDDAAAQPPASLNADMSEHTTQAVPEQVTGTPTMVGVPVHGKGLDVHRAFSYQYSVASAWWQQWYQWYARNYTGSPFEPLGAVPPAAVLHGAAAAGMRPPPQPPHRVATGAMASGSAAEQEQQRGGAWQDSTALHSAAPATNGSGGGTASGVPRPGCTDKSKVRISQVCSAICPHQCAHARTCVMSSNLPSSCPAHAAAQTLHFE